MKAPGSILLFLVFVNVGFAMVLLPKQPEAGMMTPEPEPASVADYFDNDNAGTGTTENADFDDIEATVTLISIWGSSTARDDTAKGTSYNLEDYYIPIFLMSFLLSAVLTTSIIAILFIDVPVQRNVGKAGAELARLNPEGAPKKPKRMLGRGG